MTHACRSALLGLSLAVGGSATALAQTNESQNAPKATRLQVGLALGSTTMPGQQTSDSIGPSLVWRWRGRFSRRDDRWAFAYRFSSFDSQLSSPLGSGTLPIGDVKVRPLMVGMEYKMPRGRWNWAAGASVGWAINSVDTPAAYHQRALADAGVNDLWVDVHNSLVWGPRLKGWYDINRKMSVMVESSYLVARPGLEIRAFGRTSKQHLHADALVVKAGIVYGVF